MNRGLLVLAWTLAASPLVAQTLGLLGVESTTPAGTAATALVRDAWPRQEQNHAVVYATADLRALSTTVGDALAADVLRGVLGIERAEDVARVSRVAARSVFATLKNPEETRLFQ